MTEIGFWIEPTFLENLVIKVEEIAKENYTWVRLQRPFALQQLIQPHEKPLLDLLIKEEKLFQQKGGTPSLNLFHVATSHTLDVLQLLGSTQKLFFKDKQLIVDLVTPVQFYYEVDSIDEETIQVTGQLKWRDQILALATCDWIGPGRSSWWIQGISLKKIATSVSWKELKTLYQAKTLFLKGIERQAFLQEHRDADEPTLIFKSEPIFQSDPLPILVLKDRLGAFADLWMDYGGQRILFQTNENDIKLTHAKKIKRHLQTEQGWEKDLLETDFVRKWMPTSSYYCPLDKVGKSLAFLLEIGWRIEDTQGNQIIRQTSDHLSVEQNVHTFHLKGHLNFDNYKADLTHIQGAFNRRERFIHLAPGTIGLLDGSYAWQELLQEGEIVGDALQLNRSQIGTLTYFSEQSTSLKEQLQHLQPLQNIEISHTFCGQLRPYQQEGLNWLSFLANNHLGGLLADDMGLGKTVQILSLIASLPNDQSHLIVVPTSLLFNWKNEIEKFLPSCTVYIHHGPQRRLTLQKAQVILTSYTILRLDQTLFQQANFYSIILDEAQTIKNAATQIAQVIYSLKAQMRFSISGTPIENHLGELWAQFRFLLPDLLGTQEKFEADLHAAQADFRYLQRLRHKISPFILRRKKEDVAKDLPAKIEQTVWIEMGPEQKTLYEQFLAGVKTQLIKKVRLDGVQSHRLEILEALLRLRQICCHPLLVASLFDVDQHATSAKLEAVEEDLNSLIEEGKKVLVYSQFTSMLQLMKKRASERNWGYAYLDGATTQREQVVATFQQDPNVSIFFISLKAGGVGLNLTAADYVFLYDPWWNRAAEEQAINRAHRIGRQDTVIAKRFVVRESIEEKMMKLKESKQQLIENLLKGGEAMALTLDDLLELLD